MLHQVPLFGLTLLTSGIGTGGPSIPVITVATPLRCTVTLYPVTTAPSTATAGGAMPTLIARTNSDHILRVQGIKNDVTLATHVPASIRYAVSDASGSLVTGTVTTPTNTDDWQIALSKSLFTPSRGPLSLTLTLVATGDSTETQFGFTIAQGVRM